MTSYPIGYGTTRVSMDRLREVHEPRMEPEYARRLFAYIESKGGMLGIGGGFRTTQPIAPGFAPPGKSFHELQTWADGSGYYAAVDSVWVNGDNKHRSPRWSEVEDAPRFGLHAFISGEPWHIQPLDASGQVRGWQTWVDAGRPRPTPGIALPGGGTPPPPGIDPPEVDGYNPPLNWWLFPLDKNKPTKKRGNFDLAYPQHVRYIQDVIWFFAGANIARDGEFGPQTEKRVMDVQLFMRATSGDNSIVVDGIVGPQTWGLLDSVVAFNMTPVAPEDPTSPEVPSNKVIEVSPVRYYVRKGDGPWAAGERCFDSGPMGVDLFPVSLFNTYSTRSSPYFIDVPALKGLATKVQDGEGPYAILERMKYPSSALQRFYDWNGGKDRMLHPGDVVHMPT